MKPGAGLMLAVLFFSVGARAQAAPLDATERCIVDWVDTHAEASIALLAETVNISSGTMNKSGVRRLGDVMRRELDALGFETEWVELPAGMDRAGHLFGRRDTGARPRILMIGHLDTVFEADDAFQAFVREGDIGRGPGVDDMKSGNAIIIYALKALEAVDALDDVSVVVAYTGDEEKPGSPLAVTRADLIEAGRWADIALGFESAMHFDGKDWATVARRGATEWILTVEGRQAHSSQVFSEAVGAGAIFEAARIINGFYEHVRGEEYLTFNAGTILGGTAVEYDPEQNRGSTFGKTNVVPRRAVVHGGLRTISLEQTERAQAAMRKVASENLPHTSAHIEFGEGYPPMSPTEGNRRLQRMLSRINVALGRGEMPALDPARRGAADISFVAPYTDALAGMGAIGEGGHSPNESVDLTTMPLAIKRAALLIYRLSRDEAVQ